MLPSPLVHTAALPEKAAAMGCWHPESRAGLQEPQNEAKGFPSRWEYMAGVGKMVPRVCSWQQVPREWSWAQGCCPCVLQAFVMPLHMYPAALPVLAVALQSGCGSCASPPCCPLFPVRATGCGAPEFLHSQHVPPVLHLGPIRELQTIIFRGE